MSKLSFGSAGGLMTLKKGFVLTKNLISKQMPGILAASAIGGVVVTGVLGVKAGIKANKIIREAEYEKQATGQGALTTEEKILYTWKVFIPTAISSVLTISAIFGSFSISKRRQAAIASLYSLSENALKEYQEKVEKEYGPRKEQAIRDSVNADKVNSSPTPGKFQNIPTGEILCFDKFTGRPFVSSVENLRRAANDLNHSILAGDFCASLNELYNLIGSEDLPLCELAEYVGWNLNRLCEFYFTSSMTSDMRPCLVVDFASGHEPTPDYRDI